MKTESTRLIVKYPDVHVFKGILEDAKMMARNTAQLDFVESVQVKFKSFGVNMFWSAPQDRFLRTIAKRD